jgi:plastocyanin
LNTKHLVAAAAVAGALLPATARADAPPLSVSYTAADISGTNHQWYVTGTTTTASTLTNGGAATFHYVTGSTRHNVTFTGALKPTCQVAGSAPGNPPYTAPSTPRVAPWTASCRFATPGVYSFVCQLHPTMTGTINVLAGSAATAAAASVPATLSLSLGDTASLGNFVLGTAADYTAAVDATVTSTAGSTTLTAADPSATAPGHLVNGGFALAQPLQLHATDAANPSTSFVALPGAAAPATLLTWAAPLSNDPVVIDFKQSIGASDTLRTGSYAKTVLFALTTTDP